MIIQLSSPLRDLPVNGIQTQLHGHYFLVLPSSVKEVPESVRDKALKSWVMNSDIQLASVDFLQQQPVNLSGRILTKGGNKTLLIAGPCSVESREQIMKSAEFIKAQGLEFFRAGTYKPRTSPYSFQGLGKEGLDILKEVRDTFGLKIVTEVRDHSHVDEVLEATDVIQVGTKAMYDQGILRAIGKTQKPVLLKRGFGSTLQEFVQSAEFVLSGGNSNVILCERGIRTFETKTRFTLDLCGVAWLKHHCNLPVVVDPSHAMGYAYGVADLAKASLAMGIDGLLIEVHPDPSIALSDASQQLDHPAFSQLKTELSALSTFLKKDLV